MNCKSDVQNESNRLPYDQVRNDEEESKNMNQAQRQRCSSSGAIHNQSPEPVRALRLNFYDETDTVQITHLNHNNTDEQGLSKGEKRKKVQKEKLANDQKLINLY